MSKTLLSDEVKTTRKLSLAGCEVGSFARFIGLVSLVAAGPTIPQVLSLIEATCFGW